MKYLMLYRWHKIPPYHPSSNSQVEMVNGTLMKIIKILAVDNPEIESQAVLAYNIAYHSITKETHFLN